MSAQGAVRFYLPLNVQLPNDFFTQAVVVTKGLEQRERVKAKLERALAADFPNVVGRVYPPGARAAGRMAAPIPGQRTGPGGGAQNRLPRGRSRRLRPRRSERQLQLDGARAHDPDPRRPGSGPSPRSQLAAIGARPECGRLRRHRHPDAQRDLSRRRRGPGVRRAADVAGDDPDPAGAAAEREDRAAEPDRLRRVRPGIPDRLAPGPAADCDGAGRRRAGRAGRDSRPVARAADRGAERQPAERLPRQRRRNRRGERQGADLGRRRRAADARPHVHCADAPAAEFSRMFLVLSVAPWASSASSRRCSSRTSRLASWRFSACSRSSA